MNNLDTENEPVQALVYCTMMRQKIDAKRPNGDYTKQEYEWLCWINEIENTLRKQRAAIQKLAGERGKWNT